MRFDDLAVYLEGSVVKFRIIVDGGILVIVLRDFYPAGGIPGLLDDDRVVRRAGGVVVEDDRVGQAGGNDNFAAEFIVAGLRGGFLAVQEQENEQDDEEGDGEEPCFSAWRGGF